MTFVSVQNETADLCPVYHALRWLALIGLTDSASFMVQENVMLVPTTVQCSEAFERPLIRSTSLTRVSMIGTFVTRLGRRTAGVLVAETTAVRCPMAQCAGRRHASEGASDPLRMTAVARPEYRRRNRSTRSTPTTFSDFPSFSGLRHRRRQARFLLPHRSVRRLTSASIASPL